ncbi:PEP-CTERM sorting domain-containing protein [Mucisphaera sp.]|uniref:PEP-CTERM sorting domain-containing protein n=1 Tax=Mucisphaera sp. TaxID=2913024 RepID=UPI003D1444F1
MFKTATALTVALAAATSASALSLEVTSAPTTGLAGYTTYTLTLVGDGEFNAALVSIEGPLNQESAFGQIGLFADDGLFAFVPATADTDSYFLFDRPALLVDGEFGESANGILATFAYSDNQSGPFPLAQVVLQDGDSANVLVQGGVGDDANTVIFDGVIPIPEPASAALLALGGLAALRRRA